MVAFLGTTTLSRPYWAYLASVLSFKLLWVDCGRWIVRGGLHEHPMVENLLRLKNTNCAAGWSLDQQFTFSTNSHTCGVASLISVALESLHFSRF